MIIYVLLLLLLIQYISNLRESYVNYISCPKMYNDQLNKIKSQEYLDELRGYTPNDYLYLTENVVTDEPLPVNVNFFLNKY